jgi:4-alpha-glucanotransferase
VITPDVDALRDELGFPGMRVLQFAFDSDPKNIHLPPNYPTNAVAYTGTHDNDTAVGWFSTIEATARQACLEYFQSEGREINWDFIEAVLASKAKTAIIPLQDALGLGSEARMNRPATTKGNWEWRFRKEDLTSKLSSRLNQMTRAHGRSS